MRLNLKSLFTLALICICSVAFGEVTPEEIKELKAKAERGDAQAQCLLGRRHAFGVGVPEDHVEAVRWFRKSAEQGNAEAQDWLGGKYSVGVGVPKDQVEALKWRRKSAEQGYQFAQFSLGCIYLNGLGVPEDYIEAYAWFCLSAAQGNGASKIEMTQLRKMLSPSQIEAAQARAKVIYDQIQKRKEESENKPFYQGLIDKLK